MKLIIVALAVLCAPVVGQAQYLQNIATAEYSLRTLLTKENNFSYLYQIEFRNEQLFDPARVYFITDVVLLGVAGNSGPFIAGRRETYLPSSISGAVYTGPISTFPQPLTYRANWFDILNPGGTSMRFGGSFTSTSIADGAGLLGCGAPAFNFGAVPDNYAGSTCASAGFTGWQRLNIRLTFDAATPDYNGAFLNAGAHGFFRDRPAIAIVTPEPSTWVMMLLGLGMLGVVGGRRAAVFKTTQ